MAKKEIKKTDKKTKVVISKNDVGVLNEELQIKEPEKPEFFTDPPKAKSDVIYNYDRITGALLSEGKARISPLDNELLIPAFSTQEKPLPSKENKIVCFIDGKWQYRDMSIVDFAKFQKEQLSNSKLAVLKRNALLKDSDWTMMPDCNLSAKQKSEWKDYRQALRDVTKQKGFPDDIKWPEVPK